MIVENMLLYNNYFNNWDSIKMMRLFKIKYLYFLLQAIIFSRFTTTIDYIEELFLKNNFPNLKYLKLTGNTKIGQRFQIAQTFNGDSDIRVLLVTTAVGG